MNWQPNPQLVSHMVALLSDIGSHDNSRQLQIHEEFALLQTRGDFALYLVYLTSGCPGMQIHVSENARIAACLRLGRVFRDRESVARDNLDIASATYIRDECFKYLTTTHLLIKRCVIDVLAYLCIFQRLQGWDSIFITLTTWMAPQVDPQSGSQEANLKETAYELLQRIFAEIGDDDDLEDIFSEPIFEPIFQAFVQGIIDGNERIRHNSVQALHDAAASRPPYLFDNSENTLRFITNLYLLGSNDRQFPKSQQLVFETLASIATLNLNYILGYPSKQYNLEQIALQAQLHPTPQVSQQLDLNNNIFGLIDNLMLLSISCIQRSHQHCGDEFHQCEVIYDRVAYESISFVVSVLSTSHYEHPNSVALRTTILNRHIDQLLPRLFECCKYSGCDIIDFETQLKQQQLETNEQIAPRFNLSSHNGDGDDHNDGDNDNPNHGDDDNDGDNDDGDDESNPMGYSALRNAASSAVSHCNLLCREQSLSIFLTFVDQALTSKNFADRECGLLLLGLYGPSFHNELTQKLSQFIPSLLQVLSQPEQHPLIHSIVAWVIGRLADIVIYCDTNGLKADDGRTILQIFITQAIHILKSSSERNVEQALCHALEEYADYNECYTYFLEFYYQLTELVVAKLTSPATSKHGIISFTSLLGKLIETYDDSLETLDQKHFLQQIVSPFLQSCLAVSYDDQVLGDWFVCLQKIILSVPITYLQSTAPPIYFRTLEVLTQITPLMIESIATSEHFIEKYEADIAWQLTNTCASACDCINSLIERLGTNFAQILLLQPPETVMISLQGSYQRMSWLTNGDLSQLIAHGTFPLLLDIINISLTYQDTSTRQGSFAVLGELCSNLHTNPLIKQFCLHTLPLIEISITMDDNLVDLLSNAAWCLRMYALHFKEDLFMYCRPTIKDPTKTFYPIHNIVKKLCHITVTTIKSIKKPHAICQLTMSSLAAHCPQALLNTLLLHNDNNVSQMVFILTNIFRTVPFSSLIQTQWELLSAYSSLIPHFATNPECGPAIVAFLSTFNETISSTLDKNATPEPKHVELIKAQLGQFYTINPSFWTQCFNQLDANAQHNLRTTLQL